MRGYVKRISQKADKLTKDQLIDLLEGVVDENEVLNSVLESISSGILIVDNDFYLQKCNAILESKLSFKIHTDDSKAFSLPVWELLEDEEIAKYLKNVAEKDITNSYEEFSTITSGGSVRFLNITITPHMVKNQLSGRIILVRDVTEKKNQEVLLHRMENMANLTNLAAGMAHEIKNPLGAISIHCQLIQKALEKARSNNDILPGKKFVEDHLDVVNDEISHLNKLIMDFLFAVRPVNASLQLKNPAELIKPMISFILPEFTDNNIKIDFINNDNSQKIMVDEKLLREVFMNLSQNALFAIKQSIKEKNIEGVFQVNCFTQDNKYIITFADNGCGMKDDVVAKIFEPYFTTKASGTGLGMTMVYKIVKEFSGEISVKSVEGEGTCFTLAFPLHFSQKLALGN